MSIGYSPQEIESAYGFNNVGNGAGQTIVILEGGGVPNLVSSTDPNWGNSDLNQFDQIFPGLNTFGQPGGPAFLTVNSKGNSYNSTGGDETEVVQDIEWAHALVPMANIVEMEGKTATCVANIQGATNGQVSPTFLAALQKLGLPLSTSSLFVVGTSDDGLLPTQTVGNVTFVASSGDNISNMATGSTSGNVVLTGYTQLALSPTSSGDVSRNSEAAVFGVYDPFRGSSGPGTTLGSGGGYEITQKGGSGTPASTPNPNYQVGIQSQLQNLPPAPPLSAPDRMSALTGPPNRETLNLTPSSTRPRKIRKLLAATTRTWEVRRLKTPGGPALPRPRGTPFSPSPTRGGRPSANHRLAAPPRPCRCSTRWRERPLSTRFLHRPRATWRHPRFLARLQRREIPLFPVMEPASTTPWPASARRWLAT